MKFKQVQRLLLTFLVFVLSQILLSQNLEKILILHWNDFHSQNVPMRSICSDTPCYVGGTANLLGLINKFRSEEKNVLVLNAGDDFQGTPISSLTKGRSQIELMNLINPDAMTLGNHEFDYGRDALEENLKLAKFKVICANLWDKRKGNLFTKPYTVKNLGKAKVGVIGLTTPELFKLSLRENLKDLELLDTLKSKWIRNKGSGRYKIGPLLPFINYEIESKENLEGNSISFGSFRFLRLIPWIELGVGKFKTAFSYELRFDDVVKNGSYARLSIMRNQNYKINFVDKRFEFNGDLTLNKKNFPFGFGKDHQQYLDKITGENGSF